MGKPQDRKGKYRTENPDEGANLYVEGKNPVLEALRSEKTIERIYMEAGKEKALFSEVWRLARDKKIDVRLVDKDTMNHLSRTGNHQGVMARVTDYTYYAVEDLLADASKAGEPPFLILLDSIEDPHNLGAILRSAHLLGAHGVIIPKDRSALLTPTVARASAGAIHHIKVARVTNLVRTMEELREKGLWFTSMDMGGAPLYTMDFTGPTGLVVGNEGKGVSRLVAEKCDFTAAIPMSGKIDSLNASVATGIFAYEVYKQRLLKKST